MPAIFNALALPADRSARLLLIHPVTRAPLTDAAGQQGWIELYSRESEQAHATSSGGGYRWPAGWAARVSGVDRALLERVQRA